MYTALLKLAAAFASDPEKLVKVVVGLICGLILIVAFFFSAPIAVYKYIPMGTSGDQFDYYIKAAKQMKTKTQIDVQWQYIMAIDAIVRKDDFSGSSFNAAYGYKDYFIKTIRDKEGKVVGYQPIPWATTLQMIVDNGLVKDEDIPKILDKIRYLMAIDIDNRKLDFTKIDETEEGSYGGNPMIDYDKIPQTGMPGQGWKDWIKNDPKAPAIPGGDVVVNPTEVGGLAWPTLSNMRRITSEFGMRLHPVRGTYKLHKGFDIGVPIGTDVYAAKDGTVTDEHFQANGGGNMLTISHGNGLVTRYMHLSGYVVPVGTHVKSGQLIAKSGNTGGSTGPHLHFQVEVNGQPTNPRQFFPNL